MKFTQCTMPPLRNVGDGSCHETIAGDLTSRVRGPRVMLNAAQAMVEWLRIDGQLNGTLGLIGVDIYS